MRKLVYISIALLISTIIAGCGGKLTQENAAGNQTAPADSILKNITVNPKTFFKTLHQVSFSLTLNDAQNAPIVNAYVNVHEEGQTESMFQCMSDESGNVSGSILVLAGNKTLVVEIEALGYDKITRTVTINNKNEVIKIASTLVAGIQTSAIDIKIDTDKDGVPDYRDEYPNDKNLAFNIHYNYYVSYEDMYPGASDWDVNDLIVKMTMTASTDKNNKTKKIWGNAELMARGADSRYVSDFHLKLALEAVRQGTAVVTLIDPNGNPGLPTTTPFTQSDLDLPLFINTGTLFAATNASLINTKTNLPYYKGSIANFSIEFQSPFKLGDNTFPPFDPYIIVNNTIAATSYDIHLPYTEPIPGSNNPDVYPQNLFIDANNFPYCMLIPGNYAWPQEQIKISNAYPDFIKWVQSDFDDYTTWYKNADTTKVYTKHL